MTTKIDENTLKEAQKIIDESNNIVFITGNELSTPSGLPMFTGKNGIFHKECKELGGKLEDVFTKEQYYKNTKVFYELIKDNFYYPNAEPNEGHKKIAELEKAKKVIGVLTENMDGLHQMAGSKKVIEFNGNFNEFYCERCSRINKNAKTYKATDIINNGDIVRCDVDGCGNYLRPKMKFYLDQIEDSLFTEVEKMAKKADVIVVAGSELSEPPFSNLPSMYFRRCKIVAICENSDCMPAQIADVALIGNVSEILSKIVVNK